MYLNHLVLHIVFMDSLSVSVSCSVHSHGVCLLCFLLRRLYWLYWCAAHAAIVTFHILSEV